MTDTTDESCGSDVEDALDDLAAQTEERIENLPWLVPLLKVGWLAKAFVYAGMAWLMLLLAFGRPPSGEASYTGAIEELAIRPFSRVSLIVLAVALALYVLWRLVSVALLDDHDANDWARRIGFLFSAVTYSSLCWVAVDTAFTGVDPESESVVEIVSRNLLGDDLGRVLLGVGGLGSMAVSGYFAYKGLDRRFCEHLDFSRVSTTHRRILEWTGTIGWFGRFTIVALVGSFVTWAAIDADPVDARGLDRAIQRLANHDVGVLVVVGVGVLMLVYALFCLVSIPARSLEVD